MSNIKYVIREQAFGYNYEQYTLDEHSPTKIHSIYDTKDLAVKAWKELVVNVVRGDSIYSYQLDYIEDSVFDEIDERLFKNTAKHLLVEGIPYKASDEDIFFLAEKLNLLPYQIFEFDITQNYYVMWLCNQKKYLHDPNDISAIAFYHESDFSNLCNFSAYYLEQIYVTLEGTLTDLSYAPQILKQIIDKNLGVTYSENKYIFEIVGSEAGYTIINSVNELLKKPIFEIRQLTLQELVQLSQGKYKHDQP